jgi:translation initiation factor 3 subunit G
VGENIVFKLSTNWKVSQQDEKSAIEQKKATLKETKIKCRICSGEHWTSKCPYKDTMAPEGEPGSAPPEEEVPGAGGSLGGQVGGSYVPPHIRKNLGGAGERMGGKYADRDDLATLRVTNVSEFADEQELRDLFGRWGHVTRVFLAKDRETGRAKGFAFISYSDRAEAARACDKMEGCKLMFPLLLSVRFMLTRVFAVGYHHLILKVEFAKKAT